MLAYRKAAKGKRGLTGIATFEHRFEDNLIALRNELLARTYRPGVYTSFWIHEPKRRLISAAPRERPSSPGPSAPGAVVSGTQML